MCFWSFSEKDLLFQFRKCCHTRSYKLRPAVLRPHHTHRTPPPAYQQRATQARIRANLRDSVLFRGSSTVLLISLLFLKRHKFRSFEKKKKKKKGRIDNGKLYDLQHMFNAELCFAVATIVFLYTS